MLVNLIQTSAVSVDLFDLDDYKVDNYDNFYGQRDKGTRFYENKLGVFFWTLPIGAEDMEKVYLPANQIIITSNKTWGLALKEAGFRVRLRMVSYTEL